MSHTIKMQRSFRLESLESRELLTAGGPSAEAQYMLEQLNLARTNPQAAAMHFTTNLTPDVQTTLQYYNVDLSQVRSAIAGSAPRQPLAWNDNLAAAAVWQSQDQANTGIQSHTGSDGSSASQRMERNGYTNRISSGENAYAYSQSVDNAMEAFMIDWGVSSLGHRDNILQPTATPQTSYQSVGIGIVNTNKPSFGPEVITQDFGAQQGYTAQLLGVAFNDKNGSGAYGLGEGQGNVQIQAVNLATGQTSSVLTWDAGGGYQLPLTPGTYQITASVGNRVFSTQTLTMGTQNVEVDFDLSLPWLADTNPAAAQQALGTQTSVAAQTLAPQASVTRQAQVSIPITTQQQPVAVTYGNPANVPVAPAQAAQPNAWFSWGSKWFRS
jgi:uncharacterized protein YkwD